MKRRILFGLLPMLLAVKQASATPTLYPPDINALSYINNPTNSNLIADDKDSNTIYVMPPNEAYGRVTGLHTLTANLMFCSNLKQLAKQSQELQSRIHSLSLRMAAETENIQKLEQKISAAKQEAAKFAVENKLGDLLKLDEDIEAISISLQAKYELLDKCQQSCELIADEARMLQSQLRQLRQARTDFVKRNLRAVQIYNKKYAKVKALKEEQEALLENYEKIQAKLRKAEDQVASLYSTYGQMEGARASFKYRSEWADNVKKLRELNPGFNFTQLSTQNVMIYPGVLGVSGLPPTGAVIGFEAPGSANLKDGGISMPSYPPSFDGNVVLSLVGACPMVKPDMFDFKADTDPKNMRYGLLITYQFPSAMKLEMTVTYNMYKLYTLMRESGRKGGLFRTRSWSRTEERTYFRDAFRVDWSSQDPQNQIDDEQRIAMEREARNHLMMRLFNLAVPQIPDKSLLAELVQPPKSGSLVVADSLMKACPGNKYCVAGSIILQGLDAIFGRSSSSSQYIQVQDFEEQEHFSHSKTILKTWITNYRMD